ncbi:MAG: 2-phospho-L-lactate guanylyltransferase [Gordonia sp. (in: high G+C Gram-positive bacteria)]
MEASSSQMAAVLAVKRLAIAKTRLSASLRTDSVRSPELVVAMLLDTLSAVRAAGLDPVVVSPDDDVLRVSAAAGAHALGETAVRPPSLNAAYSQGTAWVVRHRGARRVLLIQADLPAATPEGLRTLLAAAAPHPAAVLADASGLGTALLVRDIGSPVPPLFGPGSAAAHRRAGAVTLDPDGRRWAGLRTDVDTAADLQAALALGVGPNTQAAWGPANETGDTLRAAPPREVRNWRDRS